MLAGPRLLKCSILLSVGDYRSKSSTDVHVYDLLLGVFATS